ncbi:MAG: hypothetical protein HC824_15060 [Synechococcales cyanobacterium RM1_1_8]|nr:hypothetical protein [Synechococcales cyanobacterium RM1_1_8]
MDYLDRPYCWMPNVKDSTLLRLMAVMLPTNQPLEMTDDYLRRLAERVEELILQEESQAEAYEMIISFMNQGVFLNLQQPEPDDSPAQWAEAVTRYNSPLEIYLKAEGLLTFPLQPQPTAASLGELLQDQLLEEWLSSMSYRCNQ